MWSKKVQVSEKLILVDDWGEYSIPLHTRFLGIPLV